ncbi:hypothetical protein ACHQM5_006141 [Ranunculus cassubicifolius]
MLFLQENPLFGTEIVPLPTMFNPRLPAFSDISITVTCNNHIITIFIQLPKKY